MGAVVGFLAGIVPDQRNMVLDPSRVAARGCRQNLLPSQAGMDTLPMYGICGISDIALCVSCMLPFHRSLEGREQLLTHLSHAIAVAAPVSGSAQPSSRNRGETLGRDRNTPDCSGVSPIPTGGTNRALEFVGRTHRKEKESRRWQQHRARASDSPRACTTSS